MKIWLDDIREPPDSEWVWIKDAQECANYVYFNRKNIDFISFDHDLGTSFTGYDVAKYIESLAYTKKIKPFLWAIHSQNPVGAERILMAMNKVEQYWSRDKLT